MLSLKRRESRRFSLVQQATQANCLAGINPRERMTPAELKEKYTDDKIKAVREKFDRDYDAWSDTKTERGKDMQCISTERGPWPEEEWKARHEQGNERPCLHEDVLSQYADKVINDISLNPMGVSVRPQGEDSDEQTAEFREGRIRQVEYEQNGNYSYLTAAQNAVQGSYGCWKLESYREGKSKDSPLRRVCIEPVMDPDSMIPGFCKKPDWSDMRDCWELERMTHAEFRNKFGDRASIKNFEGVRNDYAGYKWHDDKTVTVAAWWHLEEDERFLLTIEDGSEDGVSVYEDEMEEGYEPAVKVRERSSETRRQVLKTIFNGVEALDETVWIDEGDDVNPPEIPVFWVTGRIKYQDSKRTIDSLIRKGRTGQLLYDAVISGIQERLAMVPKVKMWGPEGSFDTSTDFATIHRSPVATAEYKLVKHDNGTPAEKPEIVDIPANTADLENAKQSILIGIQNAIGMQSTERKDRAAKSGKALDQLAQEMNVATAHYFNSLRIAQERQYRVMDRIIAKTDEGKKQVPVRGVDGKTKMVKVGEGSYKGTHSVVIGSGKMYQSQQEEQSDFADSLLKIADPRVLVAVLPDAIRMKGLGAEFDKLARMIETLQPPEMQAAREGKAPDPAAQQAIAQAGKQLQALNEHAKQVEAENAQLKQEKQAEVVKMSAQERMNQDDNATKIKVAEIQASVKESADTLLAGAQQFKDTADILMGKLQMGHEHVQNELDRQHAIEQQQQAAAAASTAQEQGADLQMQTAEHAASLEPEPAETGA